MGIKLTRLTEEELPAFRQFCLENWGEPHPLIHDEGMFDYYYRRGSEINFVIAEDENGEILSAGGFIYTNSSDNPDVFNSFLLSKKGGPFALSLKVLSEIQNITHCRVMSCNNIRPKVSAIYNFLGCETAWMDHYYRMNPEIKERRLSIWSSGAICGFIPGADYREITSLEELKSFPLVNYSWQKPYKDLDYLQWRYFENPLEYHILEFSDHGEAFGVLIYRFIDWENSRVMRITDYLGDRTKFSLIGEAADQILKQSGSEFCDLYCFGMNQSTVNKAGFTLRTKDCSDVIPNYLEPPLMENIDFMIQTSSTENFCMFRADGDQDRKRIVLTK